MHSYSERIPQSNATCFSILKSISPPENVIDSKDNRSSHAQQIDKEYACPRAARPAALGKFRDQSDVTIVFFGILILRTQSPVLFPLHTFAVL